MDPPLNTLILLGLGCLHEGRDHSSCKLQLCEQSAGIAASPAASLHLCTPVVEPLICIQRHYRLSELPANGHTAGNKMATCCEYDKVQGHNGLTWMIVGAHGKMKQKSVSQQNSILRQKQNNII